MKFGMLVHDMTVSGGYQKLILRLSREYINAGHQVTIYTVVVDKKNCYPDQINNFDIVALRNKSYPGTIWSDLQDYRQLARLVDPQLDGLVIHDESSLQSLRYIKRTNPGLRTVWMLNNQLTANLTKSPGIGFLRGVGGPVLLKRLWLWPQLYLRAHILRSASDRLDELAVYDSLNQRLVKKELNRDAKLVYAGADLSEFERVGKARPERSGGPLEVLSVGVSLPHRRYEDLIEAASQVIKAGKDLHLTIVGRADLNPGYNDTLKSLVKSRGLTGQVTFKSFVNDKEMQRLYMQADVFAFVNDAETWGIAVFEAVAAKLPVIITNNIGASDLIHNGAEGWVVESRNPKQISVAILDIIQNPEEAAHRADTAWEKVSGIVSWPAYAQRMLELLEGVPNDG